MKYVDYFIYLAYENYGKQTTSSCLHVSFTATKNGNQPLAVWRMVHKIAYSTPKKGMWTDLGRLDDK